MIADQHCHLERGPFTPETYRESWLQRYLETAQAQGVARLGVVAD